MDLIGTTAEQLARKAHELNVFGRAENLLELAQWVQRRALEVEGQAVVMTVIGETK